MARLRRINERNQITLPPSILRDAGIAAGGYVAVSAQEGKIVLELRNVEDWEPLRLTDDEWKKLDRLVNDQIKKKHYKEFKSTKAALAYLKSL